MKVKISKILIIALFVNMFLPLFVRAEETSMKLYIDGRLATQSCATEKADGMYYIYGYDLARFEFTYSEGDGEILINRYCTEVKITFGSDTILVNGKSQLFSKPVYRTGNVNYVSVDLVALVYGSNININEAQSRIDLTLNARPVLPLSKKVSGSITLPDNEAAPQSSIAFKVSVQQDIYYSGGAVYYKYAYMEAGQTSCDYSINVEDNDEYIEYSVQYEILDGGNFPDYVERGYYTYYGTKSSDCHRILVGNDTKVDFNVIKKTSISGTVNRNGYNGSINILAYNDKGGYITSYYIAGGASKYELALGADMERLSLMYNLGNDTSGYLTEGYYTQNGTVPYQNAKELLSVESISNAQIDILRARKITGKIIYAQGLSQVRDYINIEAVDNNGNRYYTFEEKEIGSYIIDYCINVPYDSNTYAIWYSSEYMCGYVGNEGGFTQEREQARLYEIADKDLQLDDIQINQPKIYGAISLPEGETAGVGGITAMVYIQRINNNSGEINVPFSVTASIPNGANSATYELPYYVVGYNYSYTVKCDTIGNSGYTNIKNDSYEIYPTYTDKNYSFSLMRYSVFSGTISLPNGMTAQSDYTVTVDNGYQSKEVKILSGLSSCTYSLFGPISGEFKIRYNIVGHPEFLMGYYSDEGTVFNPDKADYINETTQSINNLNMTILLSPSISGIISVPEGVEVPEDGLDVTLYARRWYAEIVLPKGQSQAAYTVYIQRESVSETYLRYYINNNAEGLWSTGYYTPEGVTLSNPIYIPMQNNKAENIDFTLMKKRQITGEIKLPNDETAVNDIIGNVYTDVDYGSNLVQRSESISDASLVEVEKNDSKSDISSGGGVRGGGGVRYSVPASSILIQSGQNIGSYTAYIPDDVFAQGYRLYYNLTVGSAYYVTGYFSNSRTTSLYSNADILPLSANNTTLTLLKQMLISGSVSKPAGFNGAFELIIFAYLSYSADFKNYKAQGSYLRFESSETMLPYSMSIPADALQCAFGYDIYGYASSMLINKGYYKEGSIATDIGDAELFPTTADITDINFMLKTIEPVAGQEIQINDMLDYKGNSYDVRNDIYLRNHFSVPLNNASDSVISGKLFVTLYDENNKVTGTAVTNIYQQPWSSGEIHMHFNNAPPFDTKKIKIMVWNDSLAPFSKPLEIIY